MSICGKNECKKCEYKDRCANSDDRPQTNEEWLKSLNTRELAKWIRRKTHGNDKYNEEVELAWEGWLKAKHEE